MEVAGDAGEIAGTVAGDAGEIAGKVAGDAGVSAGNAVGDVVDADGMDGEASLASSEFENWAGGWAVASPSNRCMSPMPTP